MAIIVPAIIPKSLSEIEEKVSLILGHADMVALDLMDGIFVEHASWPLSGGDAYAFQNMLDGNQFLPHAEHIAYELDMLVENPMQYIEQWVDMGISSFVIHYESVQDNMFEIVRLLKEYDKQVGIAIKPREDLNELESCISEIDFVQIMGNDRIGYNGVPLDTHVYEKIRTIKELYPFITMSVDIGVNRETAPLLVAAGVTKLVSGSGIFNTHDPVEEIEFYRGL